MPPLPPLPSYALRRRDGVRVQANRCKIVITEKIPAINKEGTWSIDEVIDNNTSLENTTDINSY